MSEIEELFLDPKQGLTNPTDIWRKLKQKGYDYTLNQVKEFLSEEETLQRHAPKRKSPYHITADYPNHKWQADLIDVSSTAATNRNTNYLLTIIDVLTKFAFVAPLKNKKESTIANAFEAIFEGDDGSGPPLLLVTDNGTEFKNKTMTKLTQDFGIKQIFNRAGDKTSQGIVERFNRTIMQKIQKYLTATGDHNYVDVLPDLVYNYNNTYHISIKMSPQEAQTESLPPITNDDIEEIVEDQLQSGDTVRRLINKAQFSKGYKPNWTSKVYTIESKQRQYYKLKGHPDLWKETELQKVGHEETPEEEKKKKLESDERAIFIPPPKDSPKTRGKKVDYRKLAGERPMSQQGSGNYIEKNIRYIKKEYVKERGIPLSEKNIQKLAREIGDSSRNLRQIANNIDYIKKEWVKEGGMKMNNIQIFKMALEYAGI